MIPLFDPQESERSVDELAEFCHWSDLMVIELVIGELDKNKRETNLRNRYCLQMIRT